MSSPSLLYEVAIGMVPGIGCHHTKQLISYCGSAEKIFRTPRGKLMKIPGIGTMLADAVIRQDVLHKAEDEIRWAEKNNVRLLFYTSPDYPDRLRHFNDSPTLLYQKGNIDLNTSRTIGIVGTRKATEYGKDITEKIVAALKPFEVTVISGLAYGIDIHAHRSALENKLPTVGVMGSGINIIYPSLHRETASRMLERGAILTEYSSGTKPEPSHFPARNRIVAGLCDALIVVEAALQGGALITAEIANSYNREVFAVPGNIGNKYSEGCNDLIRKHKAHIYTSVHDIEYILNWDLNTSNIISNKKKLFNDLSDDEKKIADILVTYETLMIDELSWKTNIPIGQLSSLLLNMEFAGLIKALPGSRFRLK